MGHLPGMKAGLGLQGQPSLSCLTPHLLCVLLRLSPRLCVSPRLSLCVSLHFSLPVSPRLCPHFSVFQYLEHSH